VKFILFLLLFSGNQALGHDARPISLEVVQQGEEARYHLRLKTPDALPLAPRPVMPGDCIPEGAPVEMRLPGAALVQAIYLCEKGLEGRTLGLDFPTANPSLSTLFRMQAASGAVHSMILPPGIDSWQAPKKEEAVRVALQYTWLGIKHIWLGIDHLLFILCLLYVAAGVGGTARAGRWRRVLVTVTGFTLAHSITLILSALDLVFLPTPAVEAVIALSILFLALEILRDDPASWTFRYPVSVAMSFGLLHGFGFASVLRETGLPQTELLVGLLSFNLGVEVGQVAFILAAMLLGKLSGSLTLRLESQLRQVTVYSVGALSSFWLIDRTLTFWG